VIFTVPGHVVSSAGEPVDGAIVVLRRPSNQLVDIKRVNSFTAEDRHLHRVQVVCARTISDKDGKFTFQSVKAPQLPQRFSGFQADIVAGHPSFGIAFTSLPASTEVHRTFTGLTLTLRPTMSIYGRFVAPSGEPVAGATVNIMALDSLQFRRDLSEIRLDLYTSQLSPRTQLPPMAVSLSQT
jgi:hypothetical protein